MIAIQIRPFEPQDIEPYHRIHSHPAVVSELLDPPMLSLAERREQVAPSSAERYLVAVRAGEMIGTGRLRLFGGRRSHVGDVSLAVHPDHWGRGAGATLLEALIELGEQWYGLRRFEAKVFADNQRAIALCERFGFEVEATLQDYALKAGELATALALARLKDGGGQ